MVGKQPQTSPFDWPRDEMVEFCRRWEVDLLTRSAVERSANWIRREEILGTARPLYAA